MSGNGEHRYQNGSIIKGCVRIWNQDMRIALRVSSSRGRVTTPNGNESEDFIILSSSMLKVWDSREVELRWMFVYALLQNLRLLEVNGCLDPLLYRPMRVLWFTWSRHGDTFHSFLIEEVPQLVTLSVSQGASSQDSLRICFRDLRKSQWKHQIA